MDGGGCLPSVRLTNELMACRGCLPERWMVRDNPVQACFQN